MSRFCECLAILVAASLGALGAMGSGLHPDTGRMTGETLFWMAVWGTILGGIAWLILRFIEDAPILFGGTGPRWSEMSQQERDLANIRALRRIRDSGRHPGSQLEYLEGLYEKEYGPLPPY